MALKITEVPESFTLQSLSLLQWYVAGIVKWEYDMSVHLNKWEAYSLSCIRKVCKRRNAEGILGSNSRTREDWTNMQGRA